MILSKYHSKTEHGQIQLLTYDSNVSKMYMKSTRWANLSENIVFNVHPGPLDPDSDKRIKMIYET